MSVAEQEPTLGEDVLERFQIAHTVLAELGQVLIKERDPKLALRLGSLVRDFALAHHSGAQDIAKAKRPQELRQISGAANRAALNHALHVAERSVERETRTSELRQLLDGKTITVTSVLPGPARNFSTVTAATAETPRSVTSPFLELAADGNEYATVTAPFLGLNIDTGVLFVGTSEDYHRVELFQPGKQANPLVSLIVV